MGMDVSGLDPKIKGEKPKYPENYEELSDKEQQAYWDEVNYFHETNPGIYFRASNWGWRPIAELCIHAIENSGLNFGDISWHHNDGDGLKTQEHCHLLANAIEYITEEEANLQEDDDMMHLCYGSWGDMTGNKVDESKVDELNAIYPYGTIIFGSVVNDDGSIYTPSHGTSLVRIREFIAFLRECGGFAIW